MSTASGGKFDAALPGEKPGERAPPGKRKRPLVDKVADRSGAENIKARTASDPSRRAQQRASPSGVLNNKATARNRVLTDAADASREAVYACLATWFVWRSKTATYAMLGRLSPMLPQMLCWSVARVEGGRV